MKQKFHTEIWKSSQHHEEKHFFLTNHYHTYVFGYNPLIISKAKVKKIMNILGVVVDKHQD